MCHVLTRDLRLAEVKVGTMMAEPACARRHLGDSFKWLFYGDDDTLFLLEGAMRITRHLDPDMPYFLTGGPILAVFLHHSANMCQLPSSRLQKVPDT